jgi:predicted metal-dependent HD superfamily phosphohydrolase
MINNPFQRYQNLLQIYIRPGAIPFLYRNWTSLNRHWHNLSHLEEVIKYIEKERHHLSKDEFEQLILAAFFHDAIYETRDPSKNEEKSIKLFRDSYIGTNSRFDLVDKAIECTKYRTKPNSPILRIFWEADNQIFRSDWMRVLRWEKGIRKEYAHVNTDTYKKARIKFLKENVGLFGLRGNANINKLIEYIQDK